VARVEEDADWVRQMAGPGHDHPLVDRTRGAVLLDRGPGRLRPLRRLRPLPAREDGAHADLQARAKDGLLAGDHHGAREPPQTWRSD